LVLNTGVPLGFDDEDPVCSHQIESIQQRLEELTWLGMNRLPKGTGACCHEEDAHFLVIRKPVDDSLSFGREDLAVDAHEYDVLCAEVPGDKVQRSRPAGEDDAKRCQ